MIILLSLIGLINCQTTVAYTDWGSNWDFPVYRDLTQNLTSYDVNDMGDLPSHFMFSELLGFLFSIGFENQVPTRYDLILHIGDQSRVLMRDCVSTHATSTNEGIAILENAQTVDCFSETGYATVESFNDLSYIQFGGEKFYLEISSPTNEDNTMELGHYGYFYTPVLCGDGNLDSGEECDDGNYADGDGCDTSCAIEDPLYDCSTPGQLCVWHCGNGVYQPDSPYFEECDSQFGCSDECVALPRHKCTRKTAVEAECILVCGNGQVDEGEPCEDDNLEDGDGCTSLCEVERGYYCRVLQGDTLSTCSYCGNGILDALEQCDDGNNNSGDGCEECRVQKGWSCPMQGKPCFKKCKDNEIFSSFTGDCLVSPCHTIENCEFLAERCVDWLNQPCS